MAVARIGAGAGGTSTGAAVTFNGPSIATSDAHTVAIVAVGISVSSNSTATTCGVTYGGVAMTQLDLTLLGSTTSRNARGLYYLFNPGTGTKSVVVTPGGASTKAGVRCQAVAFSGVAAAGIGAAQTASATTHSATSVANGYDIRALVNGAVLSSPNQTQEYLSGASVGGDGDYLCVQTAAGTGSSISFTCSGTATTPGSTAVALSPYIPPTPGPAISTLTDDFNTGTTPDAGKWAAAAGSPSLSGGELLIPASAALHSPITYDVTGGSAFCQAKAVVAGSVFIVTEATDDGWQFNSSSQAEVMVAGTGNGVTRTHTSGDWYRIRESGGTLFWDYSTDGTNWTNAHSAASSGSLIDATNVTPFFGGGSSGTAHFDNFNTVPAATNTAAFFAMF